MTLLEVIHFYGNYASAILAAQSGLPAEPLLLHKLGVHEKRCPASTRNVTVEEDIAYSLIGIFKSDIRLHYDEGADALGHPLEEIVARTDEVIVLGWSGRSS